MLRSTRISVARAPTQVSTPAGHGLGEETKPATRPTVSMEHLLDTMRAPSTIDFLSLDVEGAELAILRSFPFQRYTVRPTAVECPVPRALQNSLWRAGSCHNPRSVKWRGRRGARVRVSMLCNPSVRVRMQVRCMTVERPTYELQRLLRQHGFAFVRTHGWWGDRPVPGRHSSRAGTTRTYQLQHVGRPHTVDNRRLVIGAC